MIKLAESIATKAHEGQFRRDGVTPYIKHPKRVAELVGGDTEAQAVAWLHDTIEDTDLTLIYLFASGLPVNIVSAVEMITKLEDESYDDYIGFLSSSSLAVKVKIADMVANLTDSPTENQIKKYTKVLMELT